MSSQRQSIVEVAKARRGKNENFRKRIQTLSNKCSELQQDYEAKVYFVVCRNGRFYTYTSTDEPSWPPGTEELARSASFFLPQANIS
jgi:hypothetical protein